MISTEDAASQHYLTRTYTEADGLQSSMIFDIVQDSSGLIWIARRSGISSYNGQTFTNYTISDGLKPASYVLLKIDEKGVLWAMNDAGDLDISKYTGKEWKIFSYRQDFKIRYGINYLSFDVCYSDNKPVFILGSELDGVFIGKNGVWKQFKTNQGLMNNRIHSVRCLNGVFYIATDQGLSLIRDQKIENNPPVSKQLPRGAILGMTSKKDKLWLLGSNWLGYISEGQFYPVSDRFNLPVNSSWNRCFLYADDEDNVFFGNPYYVFCYSGQTKKVESIESSNGLISKGGTAALVDREKNIWITGYRGITKISSRRFANYAKADGLLSNEVTSALEMSPGHYVFGHDCALSFFDGIRFTGLILDPGKFTGNYDTRILDLDKDISGNLWCASSGLGLARLDQNRKVTWYNDKNGLKGIANTVLQLSNGKIFAGTSAGLFEFSGNAFLPVILPNLSQVGIRKIFPGPGNSMYLATLGHGLVFYKEGRVSVFKPVDNVLALNTYSFLTDSRNRIWVGTSGGLFTISDTVLTKVSDKGLCISRPVYNILEDHSGLLWFGTDNGIFRWDGSNLDHFTTRDGLSGQEINRDACFLDHNNHIWCGTNNGLTVYRQEFDYDPEKVPPPKVRLLSVVAGLDTLEPSRDIFLSNDQNNLTFTFSIISFIDENQVYYKFKLENFDTSWSDNIHYIDHELRFNNLRPGTYRLQFKACNALGIWSNTLHSGTIKILQPIWLRWWFLLLSFAFLAVIAGFTGRFIFMARYNSKLEKMVAVRTAELTESNAAKDNFFSIIAHDLKSPFNVILGMLDLLTSDYNDYSEDERKNILLKLKSASVRTINLLENLLTWARSQKGLLPVIPEEIKVVDLIDENLTLMESAAHGKKINMVKTGDENLTVRADRNMMNTIIRNLISNAIKFTYPGGKVEIHTARKGPAIVEISIKDDGCGMSARSLGKLFKIDTRLATKGTRDEVGTGLGLILCKDFIEKNMGTIQVISEEGKGSTFTFTLPSENSL